MGESDLWIVLGTVALILGGFVATCRPAAMFGPRQQRRGPEQAIRQDVTRSPLTPVPQQIVRARWRRGSSGRWRAADKADTNASP
jgi:hypothetical protein